MTYNELQSLPYDHEVKTFDVGDPRVSVVEVTPENRAGLVHLALSMYANEPCRICGVLLTMDDILQNAVYAGYSADSAARSAHKACWQPVALPEGTLCDTRMHLTRDMVAQLVVVLQQWLVATGDDGNGAI